MTLDELFFRCAYQKGMWAANLPFKILGFFEFWVKKNKIILFPAPFCQYSEMALSKAWFMAEGSLERRYSYTPETGVAPQWDLRDRLGINYG